MSDEQAQERSSGSRPAGQDKSIKDLISRIQKVIDERINPALASHGGFVSFVDFKDSKVFVELGGGCQGCGHAKLTLKAGVEAMLVEEIPEVSEVVDTTDHLHGDNPYFHQ